MEKKGFNKWENNIFIIIIPEAKSMKINRYLFLMQCKEMDIDYIKNIYVQLFKKSEFETIYLFGIY